MVNVNFLPKGQVNNQVANTVKVLSPSIVKQGDTENDFLIQLLKADVPIDLTGKIVTWSAASNKGKFVSDRAVSSQSNGTVGISFVEGDASATGSLRIEFKVKHADGDIEKFPANSFAYLEVTRSLDDLAHTPVLFASVQYFESKVAESNVKATQAETKAIEAEATANEVRDQFEQVVIEGDSSVEAAAARVAKDKTYANLKARLDAEQATLTTQLDDKRNKTAKLNATLDFDDETKAQLTGVTPITYNPTPLDKSITPEKVSFVEVGKNKFNKATAITGHAVNDGTGELFENAAYLASYYILIESSTDYTEPTAFYLAFYDANKVFISGLVADAAYDSPRTFTTPSNARYVRITTFVQNLNTYQLEQGTAVTQYENWKQLIPKDLLEDKDFAMTNIPLESIEASQTKFIVTGKNKFDKSKVTLNSYIDSNNGELYYHASLATSDFMPVIPESQYIGNNFSRSICFFNADKEYVSGIDAPPNLVTIPADCYYAIVNPYISEVDVYQFEEGSVSGEYEEYYHKLDKSRFEADDFRLFLPEEICVAFGRTIELYNSQVAWCGNIDNYHFQWDCLKFKAMKRKFSITATPELVGWYNLDLTVYDNNMNVVTTGSTIIKIVPSTIATPKDILTIGDSLSNSKPWANELRTLSSDKITMVGTRGVAPLKNEGRSGWSAGTYLTGDSYTYEGEGVNPFWDGTRFNWNHYKTATGLNPNGIQIYLGTNGMELNPATNAGNIKQIVDYIRQDDATIPIFLVHTLYRGDQDGMGNEIGTDGYAYSKGNWKLNEDRKVYNLMVELNRLLSSYSNLHFVPIALTHDSEYNFKGTIETPVNPRSSITELLDNEATHPSGTAAGYFQMADIMFSVMAKVWGS